MMRGIEEWNRHATAAVRDAAGNITTPGSDPYGGTGEWSFRRNHDAIVKYWTEGIENMVKDDRYCIDILTQISAANTALESMAFKLLDDHVRHCVSAALASGDAADAGEKTEELLTAVQRFARTR
jgi:DNA-binding FrmR family transcriptional regulator